MTTLSDAQRTFIAKVAAEGRVRTPFSGGRSAGRIASAWYRTATSLERLGLVKLERAGDAKEATLTRDGKIAAEDIAADAWRAWAAEQCVNFAKRVRETWPGRTWDLLSHRQREGEVALVIVEVLMSQASDRYKPTQQLILDTMHAAGVWTRQARGPCENCDGRGRANYTDGKNVTVHECPACDGTGKEPS